MAIAVLANKHFSLSVGFIIAQIFVLKTILEKLLFRLALVIHFCNNRHVGRWPEKEMVEMRDYYDEEYVAQRVAEKAAKAAADEAAEKAFQNFVAAVVGFFKKAVAA